MRANQQVCYDLLYATVSKLLKAYGQKYLGGEIGFILVLHTLRLRSGQAVGPEA